MSNAKEAKHDMTSLTFHRPQREKQIIVFGSNNNNEDKGDGMGVVLTS
jgi:hypothetical protein